MALKTKIKVPDEMESFVKKKLNEIVQDNELLNQVGDIARKDMIVEILKGNEPATGKPFASSKIGKKWREKKKELSEYNTPIDSKAGGGTSVARLAFTGQWLKSLKHTLERNKEGKKEILIFPDGDHKPYSTKSGKSKQKPISNEDLGQYLIEQGRNWKGVSPRIQKRLVNLVRTFIRRKLK